MGGLITCTAMMEGETRIRKVWTLGTPYKVRKDGGYGSGPPLLDSIMTTTPLFHVLTQGTYMVYTAYVVFFLLGLATCILWNSILGLILVVGVFFVPSLRQMRPFSPFLRAFHDSFPFLVDQDKVQCIYALRDHIVISHHRDIWAPPALGRHDDICVPGNYHRLIKVKKEGARSHPAVVIGGCVRGLLTLLL